MREPDSRFRAGWTGRAARSATLFLCVAALGCSDESVTVTNPRYSAQSDSSFTVADSSALEISNFAGRVIVTPGSPGEVHVTVTRWAERTVDLAGIEVEMVELANGVRITTDNPSHLNGVSVDLEVTVPADTRPVLQNGAGEVSYTGRAEGTCVFGTAAGSITLRLPANVDVEVHLSVGAGTIRVDFPVVGTVEAHLVDGVIGTGADGRITAQVGAGSIVVTPQ